MRIKLFIFVLDIWDVHVEIVAALHHAEGGIKRQWLIDAVEISCVSSYPSNVRPLQCLDLLHRKR